MSIPARAGREQADPTLGTDVSAPPAHGVMFHHVHGANHPKGQGSIAADGLAHIIDTLGRERFLSPEEWMARAAAQKLCRGDLCLTFDDGLRCQLDIALPVMEERGLTAFWFVYSSPLRGIVEKLELYYWFRTTSFQTVDAFYSAFEDRVLREPDSDRIRSVLETFDPKSYLAEFGFYTDGDRRFRYLRNDVLGRERFQAVMDSMITDVGLEDDDIRRRLWLDESDLRRLRDNGHEIGLHSHTHPTVLGALPPDEQRNEYTLNLEILRDVLGTSPTTVSHPCNSYSDATLRILGEMGITMGFRANMTQLDGGPLELPREDCANLVAARR